MILLQVPAEQDLFQVRNFQGHDKEEKMDWMKLVCNNDNKIVDYFIEDKKMIVVLKIWNGTSKKLIFDNYKAIKDKCCIGEVIGDIKVNSSSDLMSEIQKNIIDGGGSMDEIREQKSFLFMNEWNEVSILEILAEKVTLDCVSM